MNVLKVIAIVALSASVAGAAPPEAKDNARAKIAAEMSSKGPSGLLDRNCKMLNGVPVWGGLRGNNPKAPTELAADGLTAKCEGGKVASVTIRSGYAGKLPKNTTWSMRWKDVKKTLKKADMKDRMMADKKAPGGPMVQLTAKNGQSTVTWTWADSKGKGACDNITFRK